MHFDFLAYPIPDANVPQDCKEHPHDDDFIWMYDTCYAYGDPVPYSTGWHNVAIAIRITDAEPNTTTHQIKIDGVEIINKDLGADSHLMGPKWYNENSFWWGSYRGSNYNNF